MAKTIKQRAAEIFKANPSIKELHVNTKEAFFTRMNLAELSEPTQEGKDKIRTFKKADFSDAEKKTASNSDIDSDKKPATKKPATKKPAAPVNETSTETSPKED